MRRHLLRSLCAVTLALAGCGGGEGTAPPEPDADATPEPDIILTSWGGDADADVEPGEPELPEPVEETTTGPTDPDTAEPPDPDTSEPDVAPEVDKPNSPPDAVDDHSATFVGEAVHVEVRANDVDPDDDELSIVAVTDGEYGTVAINDGGVKVGQRVTYTPNDSTFLGIDSFTYTVSDPEGLEDTATVTINQVQLQDSPLLTILSPEHGDVIDSDTFTVSFEVVGCYFTSPSVDEAGCHGHKWVDGEKWLEKEGGGLGHYNTSTFEVGPLTDGLHSFELFLIKNDGSDEPWDPEVIAEVTVEVNGGYVPPLEPVETVELNVPVLSMQPADLDGELLLGTTNGIYKTVAEGGGLPVFFGPVVTALSRDPFGVYTYYASGQWPDAGKDLWGLSTSTNGGESWSDTSLVNEAMFEDLAVATDQPGFIAGIFASQVHLSTDTGATWELTPLTAVVHDLVFASSDPVVLYLAGPDGVQSLSLPDGETNLLFEFPVTAIDRVGQQVAFVTASGVIHLCDEALTECTTGPTPSTDAAIQMASEMADPDILLLLTDQSQVFRSQNGGETWGLVVDGGP
jgi:hypothetical protein